MFEIIRFKRTGKPGEGKSHYRTAEVEMHMSNGNVVTTTIEIQHKEWFDYYREEREPFDPYGIGDGINYAKEREKYERIKREG